MSRLIQQMREARAKSTSSVTLLEHSVGVLQIVDHMIRMTPHYPNEHASVLRMGAFLHDVGKLVPEFQQLLHRPLADDQRPVKHEAMTFSYYEQVTEEIEAVAKWVADYTGCKITLPTDVSDLYAFAVTHHGLYYCSFEAGEWKARREWTRMQANEERRVTLADLLIRYYPLGGAVIFADMLHSEQISTGRDHISWIKKTRCSQEWIDELRLRKLEILQVKEADRVSRLPSELLELLLA